MNAVLARPRVRNAPVPVGLRDEGVSFNQRFVLRGLYIGRIITALTMFVAVVVFGLGSKDQSAQVASLALVSTMAFTAISFIWTDLTGHKANDTFVYLQVTFDMLLVTAAVHITWFGGQSQVAPLYILVIAVSALLVVPSGVPLIASLGMVLYFADAMLAQGAGPDTGLLMQLVVFTVVAVTSGFIAARLRAASTESENLAAELAEFRLQEAEMRRLMVRAEKLEGVAELSASLAHEIKNPLASIRSAVEQLARMPRASEDEKILSTLVQRESDRLARVLSEFLDFAKAGVNHIEPLDLADIARNCGRLASTQPGIAPGVKVVDLFPSLPMVIEGDEDLMHRALFNLILNAVQASPPNGEVRIEGGELSPHQLPAGMGELDNGAYGILVSDRGTGIAPQIRDRLFDPFVTTKQGGSGLGLSIVQRAVQAHGGVVTVSGPNEETRFTIVLPKSRPVQS